MDRLDVGSRQRMADDAVGIARGEAAIGVRLEAPVVVRERPDLVQELSDADCSSDRRAAGAVHDCCNRAGVWRRHLQDVSLGHQRLTPRIAGQLRGQLRAGHDAAIRRSFVVHNPLFKDQLEPSRVRRELVVPVPELGDVVLGARQRQLTEVLAPALNLDERATGGGPAFDVIIAFGDDGCDRIEVGPDSESQHDSHCVLIAETATRVGSMAVVGGLPSHRQFDTCLDASFRARLAILRGPLSQTRGTL